MRLFVALEVPADVRHDLRQRLTPLQETWSDPRWVPERNWHLTLSFLGEVDEATQGEVTAAMRRVAATHGPFSISLRGGGSFPPRRPARVLWVGVEPAAPVASLQSDLAAALPAAGGTGGDERRFHAHVTIARCRPPAGRERLTAWQAAVGDYGSPEFNIASLSLMRSHLQRPAPRYERLAHVPLGGAA